ncbi:tumor necrosis factor receptor superfamily member 14-like isoform X1 [Labeo rohita]|uniref:Tumor necrosis factor receptor superfamily member 14-like isoform X1 n=1 Tax=Labeo rohita TaxID=84645 RepID=A0A498NRN6_LABRO|nr:tumor necrosis factor receptor superfamily member 14-like isoform X1 [Labeo rohita]
MASQDAFPVLYVMHVLTPQILYVLTVQVTHIQMDLSHPVYHIQRTEFSDTVCDDCPVGSYSKGKRVKKHCDENTSTTCDSCPAMTYTDAPNGLTECLSCFVCDSRTEFSDTVCDDCPAGSYSDGTFCKLHTNAETLLSRGTAAESYDPKD